MARKVLRGWARIDVRLDLATSVDYQLESVSGNTTRYCSLCVPARAHSSYPYSSAILEVTYGYEMLSTSRPEVDGG